MKTKIKNNERGFEATSILIAVLVVGLISAAGWMVYKNTSSNTLSSKLEQAETDQVETVLSPEQHAESELKKELSTTKQLEPISAEEFGDFGNATGALSPQYPSAPSKLGDKVSQGSYQGIVFQLDGKNRVLVGKLKDISIGKIELSDGFELITEGNAISLKVAEPNIITIETTRVIKWANLPDTNQMVKALLEYKANQ
jgi:hypothetical protein